MRIARDHRAIRFEKNTVATVGSFDGVHKAHQAVIRQVVRRAQDRSGRSLVVTFEPHPKEVLFPHQDIKLLTTSEEKVLLLSELGVDDLLILPFTYEFSRLGFRDFYEQYLVKGTGVSEVVEGYDHHFGRDREGTVEELIAMGREFEFSVTAMKPVYVGEEVVSSSGVRKHLLAGDVEHAAMLLGRPYGCLGSVVKGDGRGKRLGYPTANLDLASKKKLMPGNGIYFVSVHWDHLSFYGMASIGVRPTFDGDGSRTFEVHVLDFQGDLYNRELEIHLLKRLRDEIRFSSAEELVAQMDKDRQESVRLAGEHAKILGGPKSQRNAG